MKSKFCIISAILLLFVVSPVFAQLAEELEFTRRLMMARSNADYLVTPGDVYTLAYTVGGTPVTFTIVVDTSFRVRVANLMVINAAGRTFAQLRNEVETVISNNFPMSGPQLVITQPAIFMVSVHGEVWRSGEVSAWGLTRLSSLAGENLTPYASIRNVSVRSSNGQTRVYDLFRARRMGDMSQDPFLRPGDVVTFDRIDRTVSVSGQVRRSGTYQLLPGENITDLIEVYADGFSEFADPTRIEIVRMVNTEHIAGDRLFLTIDDVENDFALENFDSVFVPSVVDLRPVLFVEGAVRAEATDALGMTNNLWVRFIVGETYASMVRRNIGWFTAVSDTENAFVIRNDERIPINLNPIMFDAAFQDDYVDFVIEDGDRLVIPFTQFFVTVAGAVHSPGRFPFIRDRDWYYYIGLAGGFIPGRNARNSIVITDVNGNRLREGDEILPETTITARTNHFLFTFNQFAPIITTALSITTTFISVLLLTR